MPTLTNCSAASCFWFCSVGSRSPLRRSSSRPSRLPFPATPWPRSGAGHQLLFSFMGGRRQNWDAVTNTGYYLDPGGKKWYPTDPSWAVGRSPLLRASARDTVFFVRRLRHRSAKSGMVVPDVNAYAPITGKWFRSSISRWRWPTPSAASIGNAISISSAAARTKPSLRTSRSMTRKKTKWTQATPLPGTPVFGHAGALLDDTIVLVDGAYRNPSGAAPPYLPSDQCWIGKIDRHNPARIDWNKLPAHPGAARYGMAAGLGKRPQDFTSRAAPRTRSAIPVWDSTENQPRLRP